MQFLFVPIHSFQMYLGVFAFGNEDVGLRCVGHNIPFKVCQLPVVSAMKVSKACQWPVTSGYNSQSDCANGNMVPAITVI